MEADMFRDLLATEGITGLVQPSDASAYLGVMSACRVLVRQGDAERALDFLDSWEQSTPQSDGPRDTDDDSEDRSD
jgi:hypothetical protein